MLFLSHSYNEPSAEAAMLTLYLKEGETNVEAMPSLRFCRQPPMLPGKSS